MAMIDAAVRLAEQGFHVFPLKPNTKVPPTVMYNWENRASTDITVVQEFWRKSPNANIGIAVDRSGLAVLDIDVKEKIVKGVLETINGYESLEELTVFHDDLPTTYVVETPSGGRHLYFRGSTSNSASRLGPGLDTRGKGGYVVGAGSVINGEPYVAEEYNIAELPPWLSVGGVEKDTVDRPHPESLNSCTDSQGDIDKAIYWLTTVEPAIEGHGGDQHTFHVAARCRDFGLSPEKTLELVAEHFNPRCEPPWGLFDLRRKIENVFKYASNAPGVESAAADFEAVPNATPLSTGENPPSDPPATLEALSAADFSFENIKPRDWILPGRLMGGFLTVTLAPGGVGKSMYTMLEAFSVASGQALTGIEPRRTGNVLLYNTEDPLDEIMRRVAAIRQYYELEEDVLKRIFIMSGRDRELVLAASGSFGLRRGKDIDRLTECISRLDVCLCVLDPFIRTHRVEENDNRAIDLVASGLSSICDATGAAINVVHHTRKGDPASQAGNMDAGRGASSLISAARIAHTLTGMSPEESKVMGLDDLQRRWYIRVDNAKSNMSAPAKSTTWMRKESVNILSGDSVGILRTADMKEFVMTAEQKKTNERQSMGNHLVTLMRDRVAPISLRECSEFLVEKFPSLYSSSPKTVYRKVLSVFEGQTQQTAYGLISYAYQPGEKTKHVLYLTQGE